LTKGARLGPYEILSPIGAGGMGEVYRARDPRLGREVAIKVSTTRFSDRFEREARAIAQLNHSNICQLYDVGPDYLVMEYVEGVPLKGPLPVAKAVEYAGQILDALDAAHRKGITHRDLKPANILVTKQGIKLLDFGLAKHKAVPLEESGATLTQALTGEGQIVGTLQYMSPEQLQGKEVDARSDLFSFGCVLYELLTGARAFDGASAASVIAAILEREAPSMANVAPQLERIVRRCLIKDPDQRFQTARDLKAALAWALEQSPPSTVPRRGHGWRWVAVVSAATLVLGVLGGLAVSYLRQTPQVEERAIRLSLDPPEGGQFIFGNNVGGIALSPDGKTAAYVASVNGKTGLWIRPMDGSPEKLLPGTEGAAYPFWSPDNKSIAFFTTAKLQRAEIAGGAPRPICDVNSGRGGAWTSNGRILFGSLAGLFAVLDSGGTPSSLTIVDTSRGETSHRWPQVLPGGRFLYWVQGPAEIQGVYASSLAKPTDAVRLVSADANALYTPGGDGRGYLLWLRGGTLVAQELDPATLKLAGEPQPVADPVTSVGITGQMNVAASAGGLLLYSAFNTRGQFTLIDRTTGKSLSTIGEPGEYSAFRFSPDGRRVAAAQDRLGGTEIWLLEVERVVSYRFTFNSSVCNYPIWSPNGRTIVYRVRPRQNLFRKDLGGAGDEQRLTQSPNPQYATDWSDDGRWILYWEIASGTQRDLWVLPMTPEGGVAANTKPQRYLSTRFNESQGRFSPEFHPRWVAYQSDESGRNEVYIDAFPQPRDKRMISTGGGTYPQLGAGGRELFYVSPDFKLMVVDLKLTANSVEPSVPQELFRLPAVDTGYSPYDTSRDGQRFLVRATPEHGASQPLTVIVNWPALLKKSKM
jgi:serine/threonine protein kinase